MKMFVSYPRDDKSFVYELVEKLKNEVEHDVWIDKELSGGQLWWDTILNNIETCTCFIIFLTPHSITSVYCAAELNYALALRKMILPLLLKQCNIPQVLQDIQYLDISSLSLNEALFRCARSLIRIEKDLLMRRGYEAQLRPLRPPRPSTKVDTPENIYKVFADAEEAANANNIALAEDLYQKVMKIAPDGLGKSAAERLNSLVRQRDRVDDYKAIAWLVEKGLIEGARTLWHDYVQKYGTIYDPDHYITTLSLVQESPDTTATLPPISVPTDEKHELEHQVRIGSGEKEIKPPPHPVQPSFEKTMMPLKSVQAPQVHVESEAMLRKRDESLPQPAPEMWSPRDGKQMCLIPASKFIFGDGEIRELPDFYTDTCPVTNEEYRRFLIENTMRPPSTWRAGNFPQQKADHPVTGVSWFEAMAYARWAGKQLPTAAEWEKAARGTNGRTYPWGESFDIQRCNTSESRSGKRITTTPIMQYSTGASVYGVLDMAGNVWEWTVDEIQPRGIGPQDQQTKRVLKGGSWKTLRGSVACAAYTSAWPAMQFDDVGFRCVQSIDKV